MDEENKPFVLPAYIRDVIKQRSTKNPCSRFARKIFTLLSYVDTKPEAVDYVGLQWITEDRFRMNKKILRNLLEIKENSLNVNLRKLNFIQTQCDKVGWTEWMKKDFTRREMSNSVDSQDDQPFTNLLVDGILQQPMAQIPGIAQQEFIFARANDISIGLISIERKSLIVKKAIQIWQEIVENDSIEVVSSEFFIFKVAQRWQLPGQSFENALSVVKVILAPNDITQTISFIDFYKTYAAFGPEPTIMNKVKSILDAGAGENGWIYFGYSALEIKKVAEQYAYFDENEPNCLVCVNGIEMCKAWNMPDVGANESYIYADNGNYYCDWVAYSRSSVLQALPEH
jgi:hypothetical protein